MPTNSGQLSYYGRFDEFLENNTYLASVDPNNGMTNLEKINHLAEENAQASIQGHFGNLLGEYRERRLIEYLQDTNYQRVYDHLEFNGTSVDPMVQGNLVSTTTGFDSIAKKGETYSLWEAKDKGLSAGSIISGRSSGAKLSASDFSNYFSRQGNGAYVFNRDYFEDQLATLVLSGNITDGQRTDLIAAVTNGKLEINIYAGGRSDPFTQPLRNINTIANPYNNSQPIIVNFMLG
jgi:hypothetical protein